MLSIYLSTLNLQCSLQANNAPEYLDTANTVIKESLYVQKTKVNLSFITCLWGS